jgi:hypothetical protein
MDPTTLQIISQDFSIWLTPFIAASISFIVLLLIKDALISIAQGMKFRFDPTFQESDIVFIDNDRAIIVKIGMMTSVFGVTKLDGTYCWRYVPNTKIEDLKLEKIINIAMLIGNNNIRKPE